MCRGSCRRPSGQVSGRRRSSHCDGRSARPGCNVPACAPTPIPTFGPPAGWNDDRTRRPRAPAGPRGSAPRSRGLRGDAPGRPPHRRGARHARRRMCAPGVPTDASRQARLRLRHGPRRLSGDAVLPRLHEIDLHLDQPRRLPRHPEREAAARRRHRQHRRDPDPRRLARRFEPHVLCRRRAAARPAPVRHHATRR